MVPELNFAAAILAGTLGSSHCLGMCGGIVGAFNLGLDGKLQNRSLIGYQLSYNLGRISSYVAIGILAGFLGAGLTEFGIATWVGKLVAAAFMIALGLYLANWWRGLAVFERMGFKLWHFIQPVGQYLYPITSPVRAFLLGILWGWLPCGLVYAMVVWSMSLANPYDSALVMFGFGLGTLPAMLIAGRVFSQFKSWACSPLVRRIAGASVILFGIYSAYGSFAHQHSDHHTAQSSPPQAALSLTEPVPAILRKVA